MNITYVLRIARNIKNKCINVPCVKVTEKQIIIHNLYGLYYEIFIYLQPQIISYV